MEIRPTRRRFLRGVGASTAALTVGPVVLPMTRLLTAAGAQQAAAPTAAELASFAESIELAAASLYGSLRPRLTRPAAVAAATAYARHHQDHANLIGAAAGDKRTGKANMLLLPTLNDQLGQARNENDVIKVAYDLENSLASTYLFIVGSITDAGVLKSAASVLPVEAQHAVVLGTLIGKSTTELTAPDKDHLGYESEDKHLDPAVFPTVVKTTSTTTAAKK
ncbi:MAG TPA: ferritin-like domain-containing protein [Acidimicrobiales bacterium]|nr:ferritin-like domain-containing protein [Acidimicrobiales bacterium]